MPIEHRLRHTRVALALLLAVAGAQPAFPADTEAVRQPQARPAAEAAPGAPTGPAGSSAPPRAGEPRPVPRPDFTPSEEIGADSVVSFPVDI
ncbi:MAG: hypothetical protein PVI50_08360 [Gammaproteobacteria bacterium]|jgi:hypothetical protein